MTLADYLTVLRRRWFLIAVVLVVGLLTALAILLFAPKIYEATSTVRVATGVGGSDVLRSEDLDYSDRLMSTYKELVEGKPLRREVARRTGSARLPNVSVELPPNTELIELAVETRDAAFAQRQANVAADVLVAQAQQLAGGGADATERVFGMRVLALQRKIDEQRTELTRLTKAGAPESQLKDLRDSIALGQRNRAELLTQSAAAQSAAITRASTVSIYSRAGLPSSPAKPRPLLVIALGLFLGTVGGLGLAFARESVDRRIYSRDEVSDLTGSVVLASIPRSFQRTEQVFNSASPQQDAFARLRTNLMALKWQSATRTVMVTSAEPDAGKSTVVANLAAALGRDGVEVIAVDADLRLPRLHRIIGTPNVEGLSTALSGRSDKNLTKLVQRTSLANLALLPSGPAVENPAELLGSDQMAAVIATLAERFEMVIVDTPALLSVSDGANIVPMVDSVLLVARERHSTRQDLRDAYEQLQAVNAKQIGTVLNFSSDVQSGYYAAYQGRQLRERQPHETQTRN